MNPRDCFSSNGHDLDAAQFAQAVADRYKWIFRLTDFQAKFLLSAAVEKDAELGYFLRGIVASADEAIS